MSDSLGKAAQGIVDIRFTPSASESKVLARFDPDRPFRIILTIFSRIGAFALTAALAGAAAWASGVFGQDVPEILTFAAGGGLAGVVTFRLLVERGWRRIRQPLLQQRRHVHVTGDGQALTVEDEHVSSRIVFSGIDRLVEAPTHLVLYRDSTSILALPKAAFEKPEVFDAFASFLKSLVAAHHTHKPISEKIS